MSPRLAVSVGCPCGIGPEVSAKAALEAPRGVRLLLVGALSVVERAARAQRLDRERFVGVDAPADAWSLPKAKVGVWNPIADHYDEADASVDRARATVRPSSRGSTLRAIWPRLAARTRW